MGLSDMMYGGIGGDTLNEEQKKYAGQMGLLGLASQLLQAAQPSTTPQNLAGAMGKGINVGMAGMTNAINQMGTGAGLNRMMMGANTMKQIGKDMPSELQQLQLFFDAMNEQKRRQQRGSTELNRWSQNPSEFQVPGGMSGY